MSNIARIITAQRPESSMSMKTHTPRQGGVPFRDKTYESTNVVPSHHSSSLQHGHNKQQEQQRHHNQRQLQVLSPDKRPQHVERISSIGALYKGSRNDTNDFGENDFGDIPASSNHNNINNNNNNGNMSSSMTTATAVTDKTSNVHPQYSSSTPRSLSNSNHNNNNNNKNNIHRYNDINNGISENSIDKDTIFQLQLEIESLRQRLKLIDSTKTGSTSKEELLDLIDEKESIIQKKSDQVNLLSDKFTKITQAVNRMEHDASLFRDRNESLESQNKKVQRHLVIREKEVSALVARCAAQEEKIMEGKEQRVLEREIYELKNHIGLKDQRERVVKEEVVTLKESLMRMEENRENALKKIEVMRIEHDLVVDTMQGTVLNLELNLASDKEVISKIEEELERVGELRDQEKARRVIDKKNQMREAEMLQEDIISKGQGQLRIQKKECDNIFKEAMRKVEVEREKEREHVQSQLNSKEERITILLQDVAESEEDLKSQLKEANDNVNTLMSKNEDGVIKFDQERIELNDRVNTKSDEIVELNSSIQQLKKRTESYEKENSNLKDNVLLLDTNLETITETQKTLREEAETSDLRISQLSRDVKKFEEKEVEHNNEVEMYEGKILRLDGAIKECVEESNQLKETLKSERFEAQKTSAELEKIKLRLEKQIDLHTNEVGSLEQSITIFKSHNADKDKEIQTIKDGALKEANDTVINFKDKLKIVEEQMAQKDEEIQNIKNGALKKANDTVVDLEGKLKVVQGHMERTEMEAAEIVDELTGDIEKLKIMESNKGKEVKELEGTIENMKRQSTFAKIESTKLMSTVSSNETELEASRVKIESLSKLRAEQEEKHESLRSELEMLIGAYDRSKNDNSRKVGTLQNEIQQLKTHSTDEATKYREDYRKLQDLANRSEERIDQQEGEVERMGTELEEKTRVINSMVKAHEILEKDQEQTRKLVTDLQDENESFLQETGLLKTKSLALEIELTQKEDDHFSELQKEGMLRQGVDRTVNILKSELKGMKDQCSDYEELVAKNYLLQDKVERQENYLKKRVQEKSRKNQPFGKTPSPMRSSTQGRQREPSPARHSMGGQRVPAIPRTTKRRTVSAGKPKSKRDELDLLLDEV